MHYVDYTAPPHNPSIARDLRWRVAARGRQRIEQRRLESEACWRPIGVHIERVVAAVRLRSGVGR